MTSRDAAASDVTAAAGSGAAVSTPVAASQFCECLPAVRSHATCRWCSNVSIPSLFDTLARRCLCTYHCFVPSAQRAGNLGHSLRVAAREAFHPLHSKLDAESSALAKTLKLAQDIKATTRHTNDELESLSRNLRSVPDLITRLREPAPTPAAS